jgi:hypothetical protein
MRLFFVFLLLLNLLFIGWQYLQPPKSEALIKPLPAELNKLQLLAEIKLEKDSKVKIVKDSVEAVDNKPIDNDKVADEDLCYTLGPFKDEKKLRQSQLILSEQVLDLAVRKREERQRHRYWVFLPSFKSRAEAIDMSKKLAQKNVKDYYIVRNGSQGKGISLGYFKEKTYADKRVGSLKKKGFDAGIEVIYRNFDIYWLDYRVASDKQLSDEYVSEILTEGVSRLDRNCK